MTENIRRLLELTSANDELKARLTNTSKDEVIAIAKENGILLTDEDLSPNGELSEGELEAITGGRMTVCYCVSGGGGNSDEDCKTCACVLGGGGQWRDGSKRCVCVMYGEGNGSLI